MDSNKIACVEFVVSEGVGQRSQNAFRQPTANFHAGRLPICFICLIFCLQLILIMPARLPPLYPGQPGFPTDKCSVFPAGTSGWPGSPDPDHGATLLLLLQCQPPSRPAVLATR